MKRSARTVAAGVPKTGRTLRARFAEHWQPSTRASHMLQHLHLQGRQKHEVSLDSVRILDCEADEGRRGIRVGVHLHAPPGGEQGWRLPSALPHLGQHPPGPLATCGCRMASDSSGVTKPYHP